MRKLFSALFGAAALTIGSGASATVVAYDGIDSTVLNAYGTEAFGSTIADQTSFSQTFDFTLDLESLANAQISSIMLAGHDIDFTSVMIDSFALVQTRFDPATETWALDPAIILSAGPHTLFVNGDIVGTSGSYAGNINAIPVPEPATWAMLLLGFGAVGLALRRRRGGRLVELNA